MKNKVSVVTVTYNCKEVLDSTILSVINQTYPNLEYIIIDGNSTDGTLDVIKKYSDRLSGWVSEPDGGIYDAMNKGIKKASGEWIIFMNAGDWFASPDVLKLFFENKEYDENLGIIYGDTWIIRDDLVRYDRSRDELFSPNDKETNGFGSCHQSIFVKVEAAKNHPFDLSFRIAADLRMLYSIHKAGYSSLHLNIPVAYYFQDGFSAKQPQKMHEDIIRALNQKETTFSRFKRIAHRLFDEPIYWYSRHIGNRIGVYIYGWRKREDIDQPQKWFLTNTL